MRAQSITFQSPREVLALIRECLEASDPDRLYGAVEEQPSEFWRQPIFDDLTAIEEHNSLETVFLTEQVFPIEGNEFKLGGCSGPTRHLHIDLVRDQVAWRLKKIWKCR